MNMVRLSKAEAVKLLEDRGYSVTTECGLKEGDKPVVVATSPKGKRFTYVNFKHLVNSVLKIYGERIINEYAGSIPASHSLTVAENSNGSRYYVEKGVDKDE